MSADFASFGRFASTYFVGRSGSFERLGRQLAAAVEKARADPDRSFAWSTDNTGPLRTMPSIGYRNASTGAKPVYANIEFGLTGRLSTDPSDVAVIGKGYSSVNLVRDKQGATPKTYHFDVHGPEAGTTAGHPCVHLQFLGEVNDIPRLSTPFMHPLDVVEQVLMDLFQEKWRQHRRGSTRADVAAFEQDQAFRWAEKLQWMKDLVGRPFPLLRLPDQPTTPFPLYRS